MFHISPNVLKCSDSVHIQILVHRQFSLNVTVVDVRRLERNKPYFVVMGNKYAGQNFSTLLRSDIRMEMFFLKSTDLFINIEFSVAQTSTQQIIVK